MIDIADLFVKNCYSCKRYVGIKQKFCNRCDIKIGQRADSLNKVHYDLLHQAYKQWDCGCKKYPVYKILSYNYIIRK